MTERIINIKRYGKKHLGLCPFHKEETPSFSVDVYTGTYFCYGCHAAGNIGELAAIHNCEVRPVEQ